MTRIFTDHKQNLGQNKRDKAMSVALVPVTKNMKKQAIIPKNMVLDPG